MAFNSYSYLGFLAAAVILFWVLPNRWRGAYVLLVSVIYYASWDPFFVLLPLSYGAMVYLFGQRMRIQPDAGGRWMWMGIALVLLVLGFFKYRQFLLETSNSLLTSLALQPASFALSLALPLGISFYTFEAISCLVDARQGRVGKTSLLDLCNFIMFWPHLMAGPIVRVRELIPQFKFEVKFSSRFLVGGLDRLIWGLVQKNAMANPIGAWVEQGFQMGRSHSTVDAWLLAAAFGLQIYFDFAGYSNMAIGAAQLLGIRLPENFRYPYHAANPADFWSRWHMTLSRWVRDYLFFPVNARLHGKPGPLYRSLLLVMALVGLWHGAGWGFVLWGTLHGAYLVLYRIYESLQSSRFPGLAGSRLAAMVWRGFTLAAITAAWIPFRASTVAQAGELLNSMFLQWSWGTSFSSTFYGAVVLGGLFCLVEPYLVRFLSWLDQAASERRSAHAAAMVVTRAVTYACGLLLFMIFDQQDTQFIYFQF
ncbi:MAG: MBOAT family O-acyltransferase [Terriglobales bacterium]